MYCIRNISCHFAFLVLSRYRKTKKSLCLCVFVVHSSIYFWFLRNWRRQDLVVFFHVDYLFFRQGVEIEAAAFVEGFALFI